MTSKEVRQWCKKFIKDWKKKCKDCKKSRNGAYGILCGYCRNEAQMALNEMARKVVGD